MFKKLFGGLRGSKLDQPSPTFDQRRKMARRPCRIEVEVVSGRKGFMMEVVDLGAGGLRLHHSQPDAFKIGATLKVIHPEPIPKHDVLSTECLVRWSRLRDADGSQFLGVEYKDPKALARSWVKAKMQDLGFQSYNLREQRAAHRTASGLTAMLDLAGTSVPCGTGNIGEGGCFISLRQPIRAGATIKVKVSAGQPLEGATYTAVVRHQQQADPGDPFGYGCAFQSLGPAEVEQIHAFMLEQHTLNWERTEEWPDLSYGAHAAPAFGDVEIPSLDSILDESHDEE